MPELPPQDPSDVSASVTPSQHHEYASTSDQSLTIEAREIDGAVVRFAPADCTTQAPALDRLPSRGTSPASAMTTQPAYPLAPTARNVGMPVAVIQPKLLQFPSLRHLDDALTDAVRRLEILMRHSGKTTTYRLRGKKSFLDYLRADMERSRNFLSGDAAAQQRFIEDWIIALSTRTKPLTPNSIRAYFRGARDCFRALARMTAMICPFEGLPLPPATHLKMDRIHIADIPRLLTTIEQMPWKTTFERRRNLALVGVMVLGGLRVGEALALGNGDIDLERKRIIVRHGKGPHGGKYREVPILPELLSILRRYLDARADRDDLRFLPSVQEEAPMTVRTVGRMLSRVEPVFGEHLAPHMFRRTCIDFLLSKGLSDQAVMKIVGHTDPRTFAHYAAVRTEYLDPLVEEIRCGYDDEDGAFSLVAAS